MAEGFDTRTDAFNESLIGKTVRDYRIDSRLGSGGMGDVYRAVHQTIGRQVAIKALKPSVAADRVSVERFFAEARAVNLIRHENIVECTDLLQEDDGRTFMVMELLEGRTLGQLIRDTGRIAPMRAVRIAAQIADAIGAAHDKGIIHRDLKPENVFLIRRMGSSDYVKILDFGIARLKPELREDAITMTETGQVIGTPAYMSPEQAMGQKVTPSADIYTLGVILFQMLTGRLPFPGPSMPEVMIGHMSEPPPPILDIVPDVPPQLAKVVAWMLEKQPDARPRSMSELRTSLLDAVGIDAEDQLLARDPQPHTGALPRGESKAGDPAAWAGATMDASIRNKDGQGRKIAIGAADASPDSWRDATVDASAAGAAPADRAAGQPGAPSTRDLRSKLSTGEDSRRVVSAQPDTADLSRPARSRTNGGRWVFAVAALAVVAVAAGGVAIVMTRADDAPADRQARPKSGSTDTPLVTPLEDAAAAQAQRVPALRDQLGRASAAFEEPEPPAACQTDDAAVLARLVAVAELLSGGSPGSGRAADREAVTRLEAARGVDKIAEHWYWLAKARLYADAPPDRVIEAALAAIGLCDDYAAAHLVAGTVRFRAGKPLDAEAHYTSALRVAPAFVAARLNLGLVQAETERLDDAVASFTWVLDRKPDDTAALIGRGKAHLMRKDATSAVADLERAASLAPDDAAAALLLGLAYRSLGRPQDAARAFCRARDLGNSAAAKLCKQE